MRQFILLAMFLLEASVACAQNTGGLLPALPPTFFNASGAVAAAGRLCTTASGGTVPLATYSDTALATALPNPIVLDSTGRPTTNGTTRASIYLTAASYRIALYANGTGNTCNGTAVGTQIWSQDGVYDLAMLFTSTFNPTIEDKIAHCAQYTGATAGAKIVNCIAALPSTGGTADVRGLEGAQTISSDPFSGVTKPVDLLLGAATYTISASTTVPANITLHPSRGGSLNPSAGTSLRIVSDIDAGDYPVFGGCGTCLALTGPGPVKLAWWLTGGNGGTTNFTSTDGTGGLQPAFDAVKLANSLGAREIVAPCGIIAVTVSPIWNKPAPQVSNYSFPTLRGCGTESTKFQVSGVVGLQITGVAPTTAVWYGGRLADFTMTGATGDCMVISQSQRWRMDNVRLNNCTGNGLSLLKSWDFTISGSQFQSNTLCGIKLDDNINTSTFIGGSVSNNTVCGMDLRADGAAFAGGDIMIISVLAESNPTGIFVGTGRNVTIQNLYCEGNTNNCIVVGKDSGATIGTPLNVQVTMHMPNTVRSQVVLCRVQGFEMKMWDQANNGVTFDTAAGCNDIRQFSMQDWYSNIDQTKPPLVVPGVGMARKWGVGVKSDDNLIPNGSFQFDQLPNWSVSNAAITVAIVDGAGAGPGLTANSRVMQVTAPAGTALGAYSVTMRVVLKELNETALWFAAHGKISATPSVSSVNFVMRTGGGTVLATSNNLTTSWGLASLSDTPSRLGAASAVDIILNFTLDNNAADRFIYIEEVRLIPRFNTFGPMSAISALDALTGFSGQIAVTTADGPVFRSATLITSGFNADANYGAIVTPSGVTAYCWATKQGGANAGKFYAYCNVSVASADFLIIPHAGYGP